MTERETSNAVAVTLAVGLLGVLIVLLVSGRLDRWVAYHGHCDCDLCRMERAR